MADVLFEVFLQRIFEYMDENGDTTSVYLRLSKPYQRIKDNSDLNWGCSYKISGLETEIFQTVYGIDSLDALLLALSIARIQLQSYGADTGKITWLGDVDLGLNLIIPSNEINLQTHDSTQNTFQTLFDD